MKTCATCGETKSESEFYLHKRTKDGLRRSCKSCNKHAATVWAQANREHVRLRRRLTSRGLTRSDYETMLEDQQDVCAVCRNGFGPKGPFIDHDHKTDEVRGLLCLWCNVGLGMFRDDPELLLAASLYLKEGE